MVLSGWRNHRVEDVEVGLLLTALKDRYGYDFTGYARASLKRRLKLLGEYYEVEHLSQLLPPLLYDERVAQTVVNRIVVAASEFFRDPQVWRCIRAEVLPRLDSFPHINLWQAGCGRGEETYTLAILLHEAGLTKKTRLVATDINPDLLAEAREGRWPQRNLEQWRHNYEKAGGSGNFDDYFEHNGDEIAIREEFKTSIEFLQHNLVTDDDFLEVQFIVCRNVLIYFDEKLQERVLGVFSRSLQRGGYLMLGRAESPIGSTGILTLDEHCRVYRKAFGENHV
ncbi:CheR family methyltransferase [Methylogaea oryzae]|uniref:Chemotaxis protein R n=1 Tax=Methylogaea oryzae TaxID=1295382 RepID=A0A8D4VMG1_9GAMM|nr:CheR family methyltransferase [Methylogaea oryzae]BBL70868.1 chemotaxis protein R [Methylogaea oryzae]